MKKFLLFFVIAVATFSNVKASHLMGGSISYQYVSGQYSIHVLLYRDCQGLSFGASASISCHSTSLNQTLNLSLPMLGSAVNITPVCPASASLITCNGGSYPGFERAEYQGPVALPAASDWVITYDDCCRTGTITNLSNPSSHGLHLSCTLNNVNGPNNSSVFTQTPIFMIPNYQLTQMNFHASDVDGDSLSYHLVGASETGGAAIPYNMPYSGTSPMSSSSGNVLDPHNGIFSVTPSSTQMAVVCVRVDEHRNGAIIASSTIDLQISSATVGTNHVPTMSGMNGGFLMTTTTCANMPVSFYMTTNDADASDSTFITYDGTIPAGSLNVVYPSSHATGTFSWTPTSNDVSPLPYIITFTVHDNACPYFGTQTYAYEIFVNQCATDSVWPGDANADYAANMNDILSIGVAFGDNGPTRTNANISWTAQGCTDWANSFASGINHKHADCNGDGTIDAADTSAVMTNLGNTHLRTGGAEGVGGLIVYVDMPAFFDGTTYQAIPIKLDNVGSGINSIYGLSYTISWPAGIMDNASTAVTTYNTLFANMAPDVIVANNSQIANSFADLGMVKTDHLNITPQGIVGYFDFLLLQNSTNTLTPLISNVMAIDSLGNSLPISPLNNSSTVYWLGIENSENISAIQLFPNPSNESCIVKANTNEMGNGNIQIQDMLGRVLFSQNISASNLNSGFTINTKNFSNGFYNVIITTDKNCISKKLNVNH